MRRSYRRGLGLRSVNVGSSRIVIWSCSREGEGSMRIMCNCVFAHEGT